MTLWAGWDDFRETSKDKLVMFAISKDAMVRKTLAMRETNVRNAVHNIYEQDVRDAYDKKLKLEVVRVGLTPSLLELGMFSNLNETKDKLKAFK